MDAYSKSMHDTSTYHSNYHPQPLCPSERVILMVCTVDRRPARQTHKSIPQLFAAFPLLNIFAGLLALYCLVHDFAAEATLDTPNSCAHGCGCNIS